MRLRNGLFGLAGLLALSSSSVARAEPPINPFVEGRETNPVAQQFFEPQPATFGYGSGSGSHAKHRAMPAGSWWAVGAAWEMIFDRFTMPLGTVTMWD